MLIARHKHSHIRLLQPLVDDAQCLLGRAAKSGQPRVRHNPNKCGKGLPRQPDNLAAGKNLLQPVTRLLMTRRGCAIGIKENIHIENDHRRSGPSSVSSKSSTLSKLSPAGGIRSHGLTTKGFRVGRFEATSPMRRKRFTTSLKEPPDRRTSLFSNWATSSSSESVVRMC
jgi:hypothetical protein